MKIIIAGVTSSGILRVRGELISRLLSAKHSIIILAPQSDSVEKLTLLGCKFIETQIKSHGINPIEELTLINNYRKIIDKEQPDLVFSFTIKPNLYLGFLCRLKRIPYIMNITGLGEGLLHEGISKKIILRLYPFATKNTLCIFFQNSYNRQFFIDHHLGDSKKFRLLPGSGVNLYKFQPLEYPSDKNGIHFIFVSRITRDKGVDELIEAIRSIKTKYENVYFHFVGGYSQEYKKSLQIWTDENLIIFHGRIAPERMNDLYKMSHCLIHPSYHEGMANVILESAACARPCLVSDIHGCIEGVDDEVSGFIFKVKSSQSIVEKIEKFLLLSNEKKAQMGLAGRIKMEREFDRNIVVDAYLEEISKIL